jgi:hypothetical protein
VKGDRVVQRNSRPHRLLALEAAKNAAQVLPMFKRERPNDNRPRLAIKAIGAWARRKRSLGMVEVRKLSLGSHAAARAAKTDAARFAARAAGHVIATWHVPTHAMAATDYASRAFAAAER